MSVPACVCVCPSHMWGLEQKTGGLRASCQTAARASCLGYRGLCQMPCRIPTPQTLLRCSLHSTGGGSIFLTPRSTLSTSSCQHNTDCSFPFAREKTQCLAQSSLPGKPVCVDLELEQTSPSIFPVQPPLFYVSYLHCKARLAKTQHTENDLINIPLQQQQQNNIALLSLFMIFY